MIRDLIVLQSIIGTAHEFIRILAKSQGICP
jgi:hypothetical protein